MVLLPPPGENAPDEALTWCARTTSGAAEVELPSAIPAFIEACGKLAGEAVERGNLARAQGLIELAGYLAGWRAASSKGWVPGGARPVAYTGNKCTN